MFLDAKQISTFIYTVTSLEYYNVAYQKRMKESRILNIFAHVKHQCHHWCNSSLNSSA